MIYLFKWNLNNKEILIPIQIDSIIAALPTNSNRTALYFNGQSDPILVINSLEEVITVMKMTDDNTAEPINTDINIISKYIDPKPAPTPKPPYKRPPAKPKTVIPIAPPRGGTTSSAI